MGTTNGVIKPLRKPSGLKPDFSALMVSHPADMAAIRKGLNVKAASSRNVLMSQLYLKDGLAVIGPFMGAPYAAALLENLIAWGAGKIICYGWCGAISSSVNIGDIVIPARALIDEGTSRGYFSDNPAVSFPDAGVQEKLKSLIDIDAAEMHSGAVWTTDALFNETPEKISCYQSKGVLAVEMEASALFTVARYRSTAIGSLLVVSDDLSKGNWMPGFSGKAFKSTRHRICQMLPDILKQKGNL